MIASDSSDASARVLDAAEQLFIQHGYAAVTLRTIADALGMRQASLYYHFPEGKEQLFVAMATRVFERHRVGLQAVIESAGGDLALQLQAVADWFGSQPPINLLGMMHADMPALSKTAAAHLSQLVNVALFSPLRQLFVQAQTRGEIRSLNPDLLAGCFLSMMNGLNFAQQQPHAPPRQVMVQDIITLLLDGLHPRLGQDA